MAVYNSNLTSDISRLRVVLNDELPISVGGNENTGGSVTSASTTPVQLLPPTTITGLTADEGVLVIVSAACTSTVPGDSVRFYIYVNGASVRTRTFKTNNDTICFAYIAKNLSGNVPIAFYVARAAGTGTITVVTTALDTMRFKRRT